MLKSIASLDKQELYHFITLSLYHFIAATSLHRLPYVPPGVVLESPFEIRLELIRKLAEDAELDRVSTAARGPARLERGDRCARGLPRPAKARHRAVALVHHQRVDHRRHV